MTPRPKEVTPLENYKLRILFETGERKVYDMAKLLDLPFYRKLKDESLFRSVRVADITLEWATGEDICPDELYEKSVLA